jgi:hypothetical protein
LTGKDPSVVRLDGTGAEDSTVGLGDDDGSVFAGINHVAACRKGSETDELDCRFWYIMDQGSEAGGTNMSSMNGGSVGAGDGVGVGSLMGRRRSARSLVTEREAPESSMKDAMIGALEGVVAWSLVVVAVSE